MNIRTPAQFVHHDDHEEQDDDEEAMGCDEFYYSVSAYKKTKPKFLFLLFLCFLSCCFVFAPHFCKFFLLISLFFVLGFFFSALFLMGFVCFFVSTFF